MAKCIIFGGNGFIGSHLIDVLSQAGHEVTCFDRPTQHSPTYRSAAVRIVHGDFMNEADVEAALIGQELVYHLVSTTTPATAEDDPVFDVKTNISSSVELFQKCVDAGIQKIFFASTGGAIYGDQNKKTFSEDDPTYPVSPYAIGKLTIENYLRFFKKKHGLDYTVFRISNPYGTRQNPVRKQGVIPIFLRNISKDEPITIIGDGSMIRDYVYVEDVVRMMVSVIGKQCHYDTYNIGSGQGESVAELIKLIESVTGKEIQKEYVEQPKTYIDHVTLETDRFRNEFGIQPQVTLEAGIRMTWEEIKSQV